MQGTNGTFVISIEGDDGVFDVTPAKGINEAPFLIRVKDSSKLDFERRKGNRSTDNMELLHKLYFYLKYYVHIQSQIIYLETSKPTKSNNSQ